mmetsp:Transcript_36173/g.116842  ORF Transcript_36173/g.116842 Transcript_36173/m.116842 type:complete len:294 (-) Transcript_36173:277-1158(-)
MRQPSCLPPPPPVPAPLHPGPASLTRPPSLGESRGGQPAGKACEEMSSIFAGVLRSEVRCEVCGHRSTKLEDFFDISLELGRGSSPTAPGASGPAAGGGGAAGTSGGAAESLEACLRAFTTEEQLLSEERCWCSSCAALQDASKQMSIERLPNVLCLQLKRFRQESRGKQTSKMDSFVQFPLASLNMYRYTSAFLTARDGKGRKTPTPPPPACGGGGGVARERGARPAAAEHLYDLFGIAVHHGTMQNGHYTAYIRRHASWFHCDDASVTPATPKAVRSCKAYLLFYIRKAVS